ncbi:UDP-3-O-(3-hydroxymyristoyl)glucosamine N-acyltransferase [Fusobacterium nucleatum]|uniref:UDP-3-O-(3-hydroxymyristoyl)glucosamine N-acyltransferase n=1 Tax=Fusobacterium nucleatum TaxID=851 RepID=UPI0030CA6754
MNNIFKYNASNIDKNYNFFINGVSTALNPVDNTLIFINKNKNEYLEKLLVIKEAVIILLYDIEKEKISKILNSNLIIFSKNPRLEYARLLHKILKEVGYYNTKNYYLKDGYYYGENLKLGENIIIEPFVRIGNNVEIGNNTIIKSGTIINDNVKIGNDCYIRENSVIGGEGFGIETDTDGKTYRIPHIGGVEIGNNVEVGALTTVCSGTIEKTIIKDYVKIDDHVHVAHNVVLEEGVLIVAGTVIGGSTKIGKNSRTAPNTAIKNGLKIGSNVIMGMSARVNENLPDNIIVTNEKADTLENIKKYLKYKKKLLEKI